MCPVFVRHCLVTNSILSRLDLPCVCRIYNLICPVMVEHCHVTNNIHSLRCVLCWWDNVMLQTPYYHVDLSCALFKCEVELVLHVDLSSVIGTPLCYKHHIIAWICLLLVGHCHVTNSILSGVVLCCVQMWHSLHCMLLCHVLLGQCDVTNNIFSPGFVLCW